MYIGRRGQLNSRQASSNTSEGNNRESSLDDSGVVDDHEEADGTSEDVGPLPQPLIQVCKSKCSKLFAYVHVTLS